MWTLEHGNSLEVTSFGARIAVIGFSFMALIIGASYTANLAAYLLVQQTSAISSVYDLVGLAVSSVSAYIPQLRHMYGILALDANLTDVDSISETADLVATGRLAAFLNDDVVLKYATAMYPDCGVKMLKDRVDTFDYGLAFRVGFNTSIIDEFSEAILQVKESGYISQQEQKFFLMTSPCISGSDSISKDTGSITFLSVYGLWVILAAGLGIGIIVMFIVRWKRKPLWLEQEKLGLGPNGKLHYKHEELTVVSRGLDHSESNIA